MTKVTKIGVRYWYPGAFISEQGVAIEATDIPPPNEWTQGAYAAQLCRWEEATVDGTHFKTHPVSFGPRHIIGEKLDYDEAVRRGLETAVWNMRTNGWAHIVKCAQGFIYGEADDVIHSAST